ncbi:unnamed protein product [Allacma fusca]|uniref:Sulfotransferase domain-containing protein n=1 Tax=Allacma fusca TaxID=39272 RepID=A0A8J2LS48_9HEXA|nr:unnamed protein product [Allacma fusca]
MEGRPNSSVSRSVGKLSSSSVSSSNDDNHGKNVDLALVLQSSLDSIKKHNKSITNAPHMVTVDVKYSTSIVSVSGSKVTSTSSGNVGKYAKVKGEPPLVVNSPGSSEETGIKTVRKQDADVSAVARDTRADWLQIFKDTAGRFYNMFANENINLSGFRSWAVKKERQLLKEEMGGFKFNPNKTLEDYVLEKGGQPIRNVIFTTWRSGSTFLGEILDSHPGTYYHYEPLLHFGVHQVRNGSLAKEAARVVRDLLNCNYSNLTAYLKNGQVQHWVFNHNSRVWKFCQENHQVCWDPNFNSNMCRMFPFQALKTVRMRLTLARAILKDPKLNIRLLYLVRDPRGTLQSRSHRDWCPHNPDCDNPAILCSDLVQDYFEARKLRKEYPDRFMIIRYEDMSSDIYAAVRKIFKFFRLQYHPQVEKFLANHTTINIGGTSSTYRNTKAAPFHWMQDLAKNFTSIQVIQNSCRKALDVWGYNVVQSRKQLDGFNPVKQPPWPDMNF